MNCCYALSDYQSPSWYKRYDNIKCFSWFSYWVWFDCDIICEPSSSCLKINDFIEGYIIYIFYENKLFIYINWKSNECLLVADPVDWSVILIQEDVRSGWEVWAISVTVISLSLSVTLYWIGLKKIAIPTSV